MLVQIVDVLRDDGRDLARLIERRQRPVAAARPRRGKGGLHGESAAPCLVAGLLTGDKFVVADRPVAGPYTAWRAEVGNPAFGRDAGAGEWNDNLCGGNQVAKTFDAAVKIR